MAVTKIKAIRGTLSKAIAYILNPEKTDEKLLVSSYGCASETAAREFEWTRKIAEQKGMNPVRIIARHVIQSFEIGEVTPEPVSYTHLDVYKRQQSGHWNTMIWIHPMDG